jgi:hypothetical protein
MLTRSQECGADSALCGTAPSPAIPCFGMFLVKFDKSGNEVWATRLTNTTTPYSNGGIFVWWYAHHGRIAWSGTQYATHYGMAITVTNATCANNSTAMTGGVDIHQADRENIVGADGTIQTGGWSSGCSHTGYNRVIWDAAANRFAAVCKTDNNNRIMFNVRAEVRKVDLFYSNLGNLVTGGAGYWLTTSDIEPGQTAAADGDADVHLLNFSVATNGNTATLANDIVLSGAVGVNERAPHLAAYGSDKLLAAWETTSKKGDIARTDATRKLFIQVLSRATGAVDGPALNVAVLGNRYQDFVAFPDGSVAFLAPGSTATKIKILRVLPCN